MTADATLIVMTVRFSDHVNLFFPRANDTAPRGLLVTGYGVISFASVYQIATRVFFCKDALTRKTLRASNSQTNECTYQPETKNAICPSPLFVYRSY